MRSRRGTRVPKHLIALLLTSALAASAGAQPLRVSARARTAHVSIPAPDLPGQLDPRLADVGPGEEARAALARIVADPGTVLEAYAPVRAAPEPAEVRPTLDPQPSPARLVPAALSTPGVATEAAPVPGALRAAQVDVSGLDFRDAVSTMLLVPVQVPDAAALESAAVAATPAVEAPALSATAAREPGDASPATDLDATALGAAIQAFVGTAPVPVGGRINAAQATRFKERQALQIAYAARDNLPLWIENGRFNARARAALSRIDHAAEDGLDLKAYPVAVPRAGDDVATLAADELAMTQAVVAYGRQASGGRVDPSRLAPLIAAKPDVADAARVIDAVTAAPDAGEALRAFNPSQKGYLALRAKLAELRRNSDTAGAGPIPYGPTLKPGMRDARVPLIRARFGLDTGTQPAGEGDALVYDTRVAAAVADFQRTHHMPASGVLTARTIAALSGGDPRRLEAEIIANMERWRWLPRDLGENRIVVNVPDFTLDVFHGDDVVHHTRVVVGQPDKPTPLFSETMKFIIVNPYWNVPLSIVQNEMMPKLAADPNYFADHGYEVVERGGVTYVRQPPGESNALGRIKFMFPNQYSVYLHDTNARALFGKERRALSHGCVRVEAPFALAEAVLGRENGWTEARVKRMIGGGERTINLPAPLPIHIVYFTAFVDDAGELKLRDDVYGYSAKLRAALGLDG